MTRYLHNAVERMRMFYINKLLTLDFYDTSALYKLTLSELIEEYNSNMTNNLKYKSVFKEATHVKGGLSSKIKSREL